MNDASKLLVGVWTALAVATVASWQVGEGSGDAAVLALLGLAFTKVWLVGRHFMELRHAPPVLRGLFDAYVVVVPVGLSVLFLVG